MVSGRRDASGGQHPARGRRRVGTPTLLFAFLGSAVTWAIHFNLVYFINTLFCTEGWRGGDLVVLLSAIPFGAVSAASGLVAYRKWRDLRQEASWEEGVADAGGHRGSILMMGAAGSVLFTALIVLESFGPIYVPPCAEFMR